MTQKTVYYAHFMGLYNTKQEERDVETLRSLGFIVINPNNTLVSECYRRVLSDNPHLSFNETFDMVFGHMVRYCDVFAYRALPNGQITGGVALELKEALKQGKLIIELPNVSSLPSRYMDGDETRAYMQDIGLR